MSELQDLSVAGLSVSRETLAALHDFESLVRRWNSAINLVSKSSLHELWARHIVDSAQVFTCRPATAKSWVDLGSGGGFPGIIIAVLAKELAPEMHVTLVESDLRKATFLRQAASSLGLNVSVLSQRIESVEPQAAEILSARALASLAELLNYTDRHLLPSGTAIFPKGARYMEEVSDARKSWRFDLEVVPSQSDSQAAILAIRNIHRVSD